MAPPKAKETVAPSDSGRKSPAKGAAASAPATQPASGFLNGFLVGVVFAGVVLIGGGFAAIKLEKVPPNLLALVTAPSSSTCPACPTCATNLPAGQSINSRECKTDLMKCQGQLTDMQSVHIETKADAKDNEKMRHQLMEFQYQAGKSTEAAKAAATEIAKCHEDVKEKSKEATECQEQLSSAKAAGGKAHVGAAGSGNNPTQVVLEILDSDSLRACDAGVINAACPDLAEAMRTWSKAITSLKSLLQGKEHNFANFIEQISADADYFLSGQHPQANSGEMYSVSAANNRQVLDAVRSWVQQGN